MDILPDMIMVSAHWGKRLGRKRWSVSQLQNRIVTELSLSDLTCTDTDYSGNSSMKPY